VFSGERGISPERQLHRSQASVWYLPIRVAQGGSKRLFVGPCLADKEAGSGVGLEVLGMHGHIADEEDGPPGRIERKGMSEPKGCA
jgi:hypothetical protein